MHAAAYWGQKETSQLLADNLADMDAKNFVVSQIYLSSMLFRIQQDIFFLQGQTAFDLADTQEMCRYLEDLKKKQNKEEVLNRRQAKKRTELADRPAEAETPNKLKKVEVEIAGKNDKISDNIGKRNFLFWCITCV